MFFVLGDGQIRPALVLSPPTEGRVSLQVFLQTATDVHEGQHEDRSLPATKMRLASGDIVNVVDDYAGAVDVPFDNSEIPVPRTWRLK